MGSRLEKTSKAVRKRIENHTFDDEDGDEYKGSAFGGFSDYFRRKKIKLQNLDAELRSHSDDKPQIFRGIVAHVNGYTQPSLYDIHKLIVQHGGGFMQYLDGKTTVTHIVASSLTPKKAVEFKRYRIVKPAWVVESVKAGRLLPWDTFRVLDEGAGQRVIGFDGGKVVNQVSQSSRGYRDQTDASWYTDQLKSGNSTARPLSPPHLLTQFPTLDGTDLVDDLPPSTQKISRELDGTDEIDDMPSSTQKSATNTSTKEQAAQKRLVSISQRSSPELQQTPQLIRDLRQFRDSPSELEQREVEGLPTSQARIEMKHDKVQEQETVEDRDEAMQAENLAEHISDPAGNSPPGEQPMDELLLRIDHGWSIKRPSDADTVSLYKRKQLTAEEHNAILLADPNVRKSTVVHPEFLEQYYRESRLHHLSAWKADLKSQLQAMAEEKSASQKLRQNYPAAARRYILHVDFDSFFAAISLKKDPEYKDKPAVVAHGGGSGSEIASCNYPARKFGVTNGMWMRKAQELCPDLKVLPYDFPAYEEASRAFYEEIIATGGIVQSVSIDEALVDVSLLCFSAAGTDGVKRDDGSVFREQSEADSIAQKLRAQVKARTECEVSVGIGGNILLAKVALRKAKPAGQYHIRPEDVLDFIGELEVTSLPGVAYSIGGKLEEMGIRFVKNIRDVSKEKMTAALGPKTGERLWEYSRGIDRKQVGDMEIRKSVSAEVNWGVRFYNQEQVNEFISNLCGELNKRLLKEGVKGRQLSVKVMRRAKDAPLDPPKHLGHGKCDTFNKSLILGVATNAKEILTKETLSMLKSFGFSPGELRGLGVQMTKLEPIRSAIEGQAESSQRRLQFKMAEPKKAPGKAPEPLEDIIEDVVTPKKPRAPPDKVGFGPAQLNRDSPSRKPLNIFGTQFILPSQIDPQVLAELPPDIRSKLAQQMNSKKGSAATSDGQGNGQPFQSTPKVFTALPSESQLDPDILDFLPEEVRAEILDFYNKSPQRHKVGEQAALPQSPRKTRAVNVVPSKRSAGTAVRRRGRPGKFDVRSNGSNSTLTQTFMGARFVRHPSNDETTATDTETEEPKDKLPAKPMTEDPDPDFLAALPEDIRREVLAEHRRQRLQKTSGLHLASNSRRRTHPTNDATLSIQRLFKLPPRPPLPTFTTRKLSALPELRDAIGEWAYEFREDGPYAEDTNALGLYLGRVVADEGDMAKAIAATKWLIWIVEEELVEEKDATQKWQNALETVKQSVQKAVGGRGLGKVDFD